MRASKKKPAAKVSSKGSGAKRSASRTTGRGQAVPTEEQVISALDKVIDPHTSQSVVRMKLTYVTGLKRNEVSIIWRPTSPTCPLGLQLSQEIQRRLLDMGGVKRANVKIVGHVNEEYINKLLDESCGSLG